MSIQSDSLQRNILIFLLAFAAVSGLHINEMTKEEPRRALISIEMMESGDYTVPSIHGQSYFNKPPMFNWVQIAFFRLFNSTSEFVCRLPTAISLILTGLFIFLFLKGPLGEDLAFFSACGSITAYYLWFIFSYLGEIDVFYTLLVYLQCMLFYVFYSQQKNTQAFLVSYFLAALAFLTKGIPVILFQGFTIIGWIIYKRNYKDLFHWSHFGGIFIFIVIVGGYYYEYSKYESVWVNLYNLFDQTTQFTLEEHPFGYKLGKFLLFPINLLRDILPWSVFMLWIPWKKLKNIKVPEILKFSLVFFVLNVLPYWFTPDVRERYLLIFYPFLIPLILYLYSKSNKNNVIVLDRILQLLFLLYLFLPFVLYQKNVLKGSTGDWILSGILMIATLSIVYLYYKNRDKRLYWILFFLIIGKTTMSFLVLPGIRENSKRKIYETAIEEMNSISGGETIHLAGDGGVQYFKPPFLDVDPLPREGVPRIPHSVAYYQYEKFGKIMKYHESLITGNYYYIRKEEYKESMGDVLYSYFSPFGKEEIFMIKAK